MFALAALLLAPPAGAVRLPEWMAGCWVDEASAEWTEECWSAPRAGTMLGYSRSGKGERLTMWEATQILAEPNGALTFWASPRGAPRSAFATVTHTGQEIIFANPAHEYPQRIRYWRDGEALHAEISLADGSRAVRWRLQRAR